MTNNIFCTYTLLKTFPWCNITILKINFSMVTIFLFKQQVGVVHLWCHRMNNLQLHQWRCLKDVLLMVVAIPIQMVLASLHFQRMMLFESCGQNKWKKLEISGQDQQHTLFCAVITSLQTVLARLWFSCQFQLKKVQRQKSGTVPSILMRPHLDVTEKEDSAAKRRCKRYNERQSREVTLDNSCWFLTHYNIDNKATATWWSWTRKRQQWSTHHWEWHCRGDARSLQYK